MILSPALRSARLAEEGVDFIIQQTFDRDFAGIETDAFLPELQAVFPRLESVHAGENWKFGRGRLGDMELLKALGLQTGVAVDSVECLNRGRERISSTRIRGELAQGRMSEAREMLGYDYFSLGDVVEGKKTGRVLGFPTLNMPFEGDLEPAYGVYFMRIGKVDSAVEFEAVSNFGLRPTLEDSKEPILEAHLLGDCPFVSGDRLEARWLRFHRPEQKFEGLEALQLQIASDAIAAREFFSIS